MAYGGSQYYSYQKKQKQKKMSEISGSSVGQKNTGGLVGGLGYVGGSILAGLGSVGEGLSDLVLAGGALLSGDTKYAEYVFKDNTVGDWYADLTEDYNPGGVMEFVGNVGHGLGQSSVFLLNLIPGLGQLGTAAFFAGVGSQGISSAAAQTGEVGAKEVAYGVLSGAAEAALEKASGGMSKLATNIGSKTMKNVATTAVRKGLVKQVLSDAAGEFGEEFASEYIDVALQRMTGVDPNASTTLKDALYAGAVGAVSGTVSAGTGDVVRAISNQRTGAKVIKNGNSQTLVNTATSVADKLAAQGTNWKKAPEWATALRGQVDAYNKLSAEQKTGMRGQTILGEMQASLYFAESQSTFNLIQQSVQNASEQDRAAWAEYINRSISKEKRNNKDYTAADIAKNTDNVAWQLAIMRYVPGMFNFDGAFADAEQESAIDNVIARESGAKQMRNAEGEMQNEGAETVGAVQYDLKDAIKTLGEYDATRKRHIESNPNDKVSKGYDDIVEFINDASKNNPVKRLHIGVVNPNVAQMVMQATNIDITDYDFVIASNFIAHIIDEHGSEKTEAPRGQIAVNKNNIEDIIETVIQPDNVSNTTDNSGAKAIKFEKDVNGRNVAITITSTKKGTLTLKSAWIINKNSGGRTPPASANTLAGTSKTSGRSSTDNSIHQTEPVVNPKTQKNINKNDLGEDASNSAREAAKESARADVSEAQKSAKNAEKSAEAETSGNGGAIEGATSGDGGAVEKATSSSTAHAKRRGIAPLLALGRTSPFPAGEGDAEIDFEKARRDAERMIEWEKKNAPTVKELNTARDYIKDFDSLPKGRQMSIIRTIRSAQGVEVDTLRGVVNLMAITNRKGEVLAPDLEFRFAELADDVAKRGIKTEVGGKTVIVLNTNSTYKNTIRGSIAHEIVHYLENRKGYKELSEFAMKHAKAETVAKVTEKYNKLYKKEYTSEERAKTPNATDEEIAERVAARMATDKYKALIDSEVTASVVGEMLNSEKFLKRYAQKDDSTVKKIGRLIKGIVTSLKDKDSKASDVAADMMKLVDRALGSEVSGEKTGEKYDADNKVKAFSEIAVSTALYDALDHMDKGDDNLILMSKMPKFIEDKFGITGDFYVYRDHLYENTVSKKRAIEEGRPIQRGDKDIHFHDLGEERMIEAIMSIDSPIMSVEVHSKDNNPTIIMALPVLDDNGSPLRAVLSFYSNKAINGSFKRKPHIVLTITPCKMSESSGARKGWAEFMSEAIKDGRVLSYDKEKGSVLSVIAQQARLGNITEASLNDSISRFKRSVNEFKQKNKINYDLDDQNDVPKTNSSKRPSTVQYDLDPEAAEKKPKVKKEIGEDGAVKEKYSKKITIGMSDSERYEVLRHRQIENVPVAKEIPTDILKKVPEISSWDDINRYFKSDKKKLITKIAKEFGAIGKTFSNEDINLSFYFSGNNFQESYGKQKKNYIAFAKMFSVFDDVVQRAVGIDIHNRNDEGYKYDPSLENMYVLVSAYQDGEFTVPVKLEIKEFKDKQNALYVAISLGKIKTTEVSEQGTTDNGVAQGSRSVSISISQLFKKINPADESFLKYVPKQFLEDSYEGVEQYDLNPDEVAKATKKTKSKVATARAEGVLAGQMSQGAKDAVKLRKAKEKLETQKEKSQETLAKYKKKAAVNKEKMRLKSRERVRNAKVKAERSIREKIAREEANAAKAEVARRYTKKEVEPAISEIEGLTDEQVKSLAKGFELDGVSASQKERIISDIYIALHEASAEGEAGPGSVAVKRLATRIAWDMVQSARIKGEDGKLYHLIDIYDEASVQEIAREYTDVLFERFANMGQHTKYSYFAAELRATEEDFRRDRIDDNAIHKLSREVSYQGQQLRRLVETQKRGMEDEGIQSVTKILASVVDAKGNIRTRQIDAAIGEADRFFTMQSSMTESQAQAQEGTTLTEFAYSSDTNLKFMIDEFRRLRARVEKHGKDRTGRVLDAQELQLLGKILAGMRKTVTEYNKVFINERYIDIDKVAGDCAGDIVEYQSLDKKAKTRVGELFNKLMRGIRESYFYNVMTPETTIEALEGFKIGGVLKTLYHDVRIHKQKAEHLAVQMKKPFAEFLDSKENVWTDSDGKKHSFRDKLNKKMITVNGADLTLGEAIYLYMLTKRELTHAGLRENGYIVYDENNQRRLKVKIEDVEAARGEIASKLDDADKAFLKMAEDFFNKTSTDVKNEADMRIFGYTNIEDGYYVPMIRDRYGRMQGVTDQRQSVGSIITVYNKSFNQNTVQNAKALEGKNIMSIINDHADGLADYSELYIPLKSFDRVYNKAVTVNGETRSIREILNDEVWNKADAYLRDLFADVQGQNRKSDIVIDSLVGKLRSAWVNSVLGLNLKVVATQTTSFVAANQVIEARYLMPALKKFFGNQSELGARADEYSDIIEARSFEMGALRAQGNIDKVMEWSSKTGFMINLMDRRVCLAVFHAAELKAEAQGAGAVGTVENAKAAAKIADEAIYTTQAMTSSAERSALQRSKSEIARTLSMFTSDSVKNLSHFVGNIMKYQAHRARAKSELSSKAQYEAEIKKDAKAIRRSAKTLVMTGVMLGLITQAFKYLYAKEEEEPEEKIEDLVTDIVSSTFNILPGVSDIVDKFVFDYDMSLNVFDVANDTIEDTASLMNMAGRAMNGEYVSGENVFKNVFNFVKTVGAALGAPIAPVERTVTGLLRRFFPSVIYGYDAMMYNPSYTADLKAAVESGDEALAEHILSTLYKNEATGVYSSEELEEVAKLYQKGYTSVIPQKISDTVNDVKLSAKQRRQFESIYSQASAKVNELIRSEYYQELTDEQRAKAIKNLYSLYYNRAAAEVAGAEWSNAQAYSRLTDNYSALFAAQAYKSGLSVYKDIRGKEVSVKDQLDEYFKYIKLDENDRIVISYYLGYRGQKTKVQLLEYINSLDLSVEEKEKIAKNLGFAIENGRVVETKDE